MVRYSTGILKWTKDELKVTYGKTRKITTMSSMYHRQSDTGRLYIPKMEGERGLLSTVDCLETKEQNFSLYLDHLGGSLLRSSRSERILPEHEGPVSTAKKQKMEEKHKQWKEKQLHGKLVRETEEVRSEETCG